MSPPHPPPQEFKNLEYFLPQLYAQSKAQSKAHSKAHSKAQPKAQAPKA